jgi:hypothetical protein
MLTEGISDRGQQIAKINRSFPKAAIMISNQSVLFKMLIVRDF